MKLYMKTTKDEYELPEAVADSVHELSKMIGLTQGTVASLMSRKAKGFYKVVIDEPKLYPTADGGFWYKDPDTWETVYVEG